MPFDPDTSDLDQLAPKADKLAKASDADRTKYQFLLGQVHDPANKYKDLAAKTIAAMESKFGKQNLLGLTSNDTPNNLDLDYSISRIQEGAPPETLDHFKKTITELRTKHPEWNDALLHYQGPAFAEINKALRTGGKLNEVQQAVTDRLSEAIDGAGKFPKPVKTYRGMSLPPADAEAMLSRFEQCLAHHKTYSEKAFVSQALNPKVAEAFLNSRGQKNTKILFKMTAKSGLFGNTGETEVIQKPGTRYRVTAIDHSGPHPIVSVEQVS
jgi:hypothetical protein